MELLYRQEQHDSSKLRVTLYAPTKTLNVQHELEPNNLITSTFGNATKLGDKITKLTSLEKKILRRT